MAEETTTTVPAQDTPPAGGEEVAGQVPDPEATPEGEEKTPGKTLITGGEVEKPPAEEPAPDAPKAVELKLADGSLLSADAGTGIVDLAKEHGLSQEAAQAVYDQTNTAVGAYHEQLLAEHDEQTKAWGVEASQDPEIGGDGFKENIARINELYKRFAPEGLTEALDESGYGNNPKVLKFLHRIAKGSAPDKHVRGGAPVESEKTVAEKLFPNTE